MTADDFASHANDAELSETSMVLAEHLRLVNETIDTLVTPDELERRLREVLAVSRTPVDPETGKPWSDLAPVDDSPAARELALYVAAGDLERAVNDLGDRSRLTLSAHPCVDVQVAAQALAVTVGTADFVRTVKLSLPVLRRAAGAGTPPLTLIACALAGRGPLGDDWQPRRPGLPSVGEPQWRDDRVVPRTSTVTRRLDRTLHAGVDTVVCGSQDSGASELVATWARSRAASGDWGLIWLGMNDPNHGVESIYEALLRMDRRDGYLVVIDGVQSNPGTLYRIRASVAEFRDLYGLKKLVLVATAWPSLVARLPSPFKGLWQITVDGADLVDLLIAEAGLAADERAAIVGLAGTNVHLAAVSLDLLARDGRIPDRAQLQFAVTGGDADEPTRAALYWFACLGAFEIDVPSGQAESRFTRDLIKGLLDRQMLWLNDGAYTIGSRTRARLVLERALADWNAASQWGDPARVVVDYLNSAGEATIITTLERMDLVGLVDNPTTSDGTRFLAMAWDQRARLVRALAAHYLGGGRWNDCIGASVFAAQAFAETGDDKAWQAVAEYVRGRFTYGGDNQPVALPVAVGGATADYADFPAILDAMCREDEFDVERRRPGWQPGREVDADRFYRNWVLGLLLGFEGNALDHDQGRVDRLVAIAEAQQDPRSGHFYPMRAPWLTARVVLGLSQIGHTYGSSRTVRAACDWLRRPVAQGGPLDAWWRSGTGPWNTDEATTAMCLTALRRAGAPPSTATDTAMAWLLAQRSEWQREGHEIDLALTVEAMLLYRTGGADLREGVLALLHWALTVPDGGLPATDSETPEQNHRMPFVAAQLTVVIWATMMRELSAVIDDELRPYRPATPPTSRERHIGHDVRDGLLRESRPSP